MDGEPVVLLVQLPDDSRDMYVEFLQAQGHTVLACEDAEEALRLAPRADAIVTGILLAGSADGIELTTRLRADERTRHKPILVLTACVRPSDRERAEAAGCDVFLPKPCLPEDLLRHIRVLLLRRVRGSPAKSALESPEARRKDEKRRA